ncbi:MAG: caspase family protein [Sedimentisphaerales bacterium]|nr:caspase family protein [Sedimentisphaerales bacterium]
MKQRSRILITVVLALLWLSGLHIVWGSDADSKVIGVAEAVKDLPDSLKTPNRYALVIGAGQYEDERVPALPAGHNDARELYKVLVDPQVGMFPAKNVTLLVDKDVTRIKVVDALDSLARRAGKEDLVVVFFSGHGAVDDVGRSYWVMYNTRIDSLRASAFSETEISELLSSIRTTRLVTVIDACYSASTAEVSGSKSLADLQKIYPQFKGDGRVAITASKGDQLSVIIKEKDEPGYGHSAFTWHVIEGMKGDSDSDEDGVVTVDELWGYVKDRTERTARRQGGNQQPQLKGQIGSKFLLAVDGKKLVDNSQETRRRLEALRRLFIDGKLTPEQYRQAEALLKARAESFSEMERQIRQVYVDLASGRFNARYLKAALDVIETPEQREARLEREAMEKAEREHMVAQPSSGA